MSRRTFTEFSTLDRISPRFNVVRKGLGRGVTTTPGIFTTEALDGDDLERRLAELEQIDRFDPPARSESQERLAQAAASDVEAFWAEHARQLDWAVPFGQVLDESKKPFYRWFADGWVNACHNCVDRHVANGLGARVAFYWIGEDREQRTYTYDDLHAEVQRLANALKRRGVRKGDVVGIYLPMIPEVVVAMLACARIGAPHNVVFGGFAPEAMAERMLVSHAKALITADGARRRGTTTPLKQLVDPLLSDLPDLETVLVVRHTGEPTPMSAGRDVWTHDAMAEVEPDCPAEPVEAEHPLFILYSSGSTAKPKGVVHSTGGYLTGVSSTHRLVFDLQPERDIWFCTADVGWITGHSYMVYGPLSNGATSVMFEGAPDYPHKAIWWEIVQRYRVTIFYTAPTAIRACMKWGAAQPNRYDLSSLRLLGSVGEPINPKAWLWYFHVIGRERCPIVDTWWQTETGQIMLSPLPNVTAAKPGSAAAPLPGVVADVVDESTGETVPEGQGLLVLKRPWPAMLRTLYEDDERYVKTYFSRFGLDTYLVGDAAIRDRDGYIWIVGRIDDVINVSGHRLSTAEMESAISADAKVAESAVVAQSDELTGQAIIAFVVLRDGVAGTAEVEQAIVDQVAQKIGRFARPKRIIWVKELPKTRSGKIVRRVLRNLAQGRDIGDVTTLRDPSVAAELRAISAGPASA